ncbi:hypothetical protein [Dinoroseobacter sp. S375]|uniref:hypothetical protein n=1 Tax=Dinoroseobacter sp. S375 TaxID=3415136 RepID=UPI003C7D2F38
MNRYVVIAALAKAEKIIDLMDKVILVDARTVSTDEAAKAWACLGEVPPAARTV